MKVGSLFFGWMLTLLAFFTLPAPIHARLSMDASNTGFYYPAEATIRYLALKEAWVHTHEATLPSVHELAHLAWMSHETLEVGAPVWLRATAWRLNDGPKPWVLTPRVQVTNSSLNEAVLDWRLEYTYRTELAVWYPIAPSALLDIKRFQIKRRWLTLAKGSVPQEAVAPSEETLRWLQSIQLLEVLQAHPDEWPHRLELNLKLYRDTTLEDTLTLTLTLHPDVFMLPIYLY